MSTERQLWDKVEQQKQQQPSTAAGGYTVLWGEADPEARPDGMTWVPETGTLTYDLWDAQREAVEALHGDADLTLFLAGYGSGKSLIGARWLIKQALEYPGGRFMAMGIDFSKARDSTFRTLFEQLPGDRTAVVTSSYNGPETSPIVTDYNRQEHRLTLVNDSEIILGSADRWNRYAGISISGFWGDEVAHYSDLHDLLEMIGSRLRGVDGPKKQLWTTTGSGKGALFDIAERGKDANDEPLGLAVEKVEASTLDNPYLDESTKERFKRQYGNTSREAEALHGGYSSSGGQLLTRDQLQFIHEDNLEFQAAEYHVGVDLSYTGDAAKAEANDSDYTAVTLVIYDRQTQQATCIDFQRTRGKTLRQTLQWLGAQLADIPAPVVKIEEVGASKWFIQEARNEIPGRVQAVTPGNRSKESRLTEMGILFERGDVQLMNSDVDENLGYDPHWRNWVREWINLGTNDSSPDILDSTYYALQNLSLGGDTENRIGPIESCDPWG